MAEQLTQPLSLTSEYLRALEARGLLKAQRRGRWVHYRPSPATGDSPAAGLIAALREAFQKETEPVEAIFRSATAFTHSRRVEVFHALQTAPQSLEQIHAATRILVWALLRHLRKLEARDFVNSSVGRYALVPRSDALGRELARLAQA